MSHSGKERKVEERYDNAREQYKEFGVNADEALEKLLEIPISVHCWQGDDVSGFESSSEGVDSGGILATGGYPGRARSADELRSDFRKALDFLPGKAHRFNLHAIYAETGYKKVERDQLKPEHFSQWIDWAGDEGIMLDFNQTFFAHPKAEDGFTLAHRDPEIRKFWIRHGIASRRIASAMGTAQGADCLCNLWIPDGMKDLPADRFNPRRLLIESLDEIFKEDMPNLLDSVEGKLFGIASESYVAGSNDFYLLYAQSRKKILCLDMGHFHPTESVADKISTVLSFQDRLLLHISRGIRWDSDHVALLEDPVREIAHECVRGNVLDRVIFATDFFDASINRIAAWVIGVRALKKALLEALLEPVHLLREAEEAGDYTARLAIMESSKGLPSSAVWDMACLRSDVPVGIGWLDELKAYERDVQTRRG